MGEVFDRLDAPRRTFLERQHVFFVATAPLAAAGHVNVSPKGYDTIRVIDDRTVCYLDISGSGAETIAHLQENGRITIMCCAFEGEPEIVRLYGRGEVLLPDHDDFDDLLPLFPPRSGVRSIMRVHLHRVSTSCGYGVPLMAHVADRERLEEVWAPRCPEAMADYWARRNAISIDGLPALPT